MRNLPDRRTVCLLAGLALVMTVSTSIASVKATDGGIQFSYTDPSASSVAVAGSFNDWNTTAHPLSDADGDGTWTTVLPLDPGEYEYKFVVNGGTWVADPGNPRTGGDFGNSLLTVTAAGIAAVPSSSPQIPSGTPEVSNTPLHSRVYLGGFFRMIMQGTSETAEDPRLRLDRPDDQFNLDFNANLSEKLWGSVRLQLETGSGGANELAARLYKAQSNFIDEAFRVQAYYNEEVFETDDPLELLGHLDLRGTIEEEHRPFGQGTQGIVFRAQPFEGDLAVLYSDTFDEDIFNPSEPTVLNPRKEGLNQSTGTDVLAGRYVRPWGETLLGLAYRGEFSDWWVNFTKEENLTTGGAYPAELAAYRAADPRPESDKSDNFEIANDSHVAGIDATLPLLAGLKARAQGAYAWYSAAWDLGNREAVQGDGFVNGRVDIPIGNENGWRGEVELEYEREGIQAVVSHQIQYGQGMDAAENMIAYRTTPGSMISDRSFFSDVPVLTSYQDVNGSDAVDVLRLGPRPQRVIHITETDFGYDWRSWRFELEVDRHRENLDYASFEGESASLNRLAWRFSPRARIRPFERKDHHITLETEFWSYSDPTELAEVGANAVLDPLPGQGAGSLLRVDTNEYVLRGLVPASQLRDRDLSVRFDLRFIEYNGRKDLTAVGTDDQGQPVQAPLNLTGDFFSAFAALVYQPVDAVQVQVGYGVDPTFYDVINPEGWPNGRQQFRDAYLIERRLDPYNAVNVLDAEQALEDRRQFVINAVVTF